MISLRNHMPSRGQPPRRRRACPALSDLSTCFPVCSRTRRQEVQVFLPKNCPSSGYLIHDWKTFPHLIIELQPTIMHHDGERLSLEVVRMGEKAYTSLHYTLALNSLWFKRIALGKVLCER